MLSVTNKSIMLNAIMLNVVKLNVIILNVVAPLDVGKMSWEGFIVKRVTHICSKIYWHKTLMLN